MAVTESTPFRTIGDCTEEQFVSFFQNGGSPISPDELRACRNAASPFSILAAAQAERESSLGKNPPATNNALGLKAPDNSGFLVFRSWTDCFAEFKRRLSDPNYKGGVYGQNQTLRDYCLTFVGGPECARTGGIVCANGESGRRILKEYLPAVIVDCNALQSDKPSPAPSPTPTPAPDPWRPYPYPAMVDLLVRKPRDGAGFDRCNFRRPLIRGFCTHITDGGGTIEGIKALFEGERAYDALTDLVIGRDGRIGLLNDWRDPNRGGTRAGWANGGVDGLEGDGIAFYRKFPYINVVLVSCEHIATAGQAWTDAMIESSVEIRTAIAQEERIPAETYPVKPEWGVSSEQQHRNFATKSCPAEPYISKYAPVVLREVKGKLAAWQGSLPSPVPTPEPDPDRYTRFGFTRDQVEGYFGTFTRYNEDGTTTELGFDPKGPLSLLWLDRCDKEGKFPEAEEIHIYDSTLADGKEQYATWEGGWVAWLPLDNQRAGWQWLDKAAA